MPQYFTIRQVLRFQPVVFFLLGLMMMALSLSAQATTSSTTQGNTMSTNPKVLLQTNKGDITLELEIGRASCRERV